MRAVFIRKEVGFVANQFFASERLQYRPFRMEELDAVHALFNDPSRRRWFYFQEPDCLTLAFAEKAILENIRVCSHKVNLLTDADFGLAIAIKDTDELIGYIGITKFHGPEEELDAVELGYQIIEKHQGKGYATEATKAAVQWGLSELKRLGVEPRLVAKIEHENWPSRRVAEKAGLVFTHAEKYVSVYEVCG